MMSKLARTLGTIAAVVALGLGLAAQGAGVNQSAARPALAEDRGPTNAGS
ncbi:MAG TPA: hypothetical protein VIU15_11950 [Streptomyces sp.]